jgi:alcohol dehydrogenase class IV
MFAENQDFCMFQFMTPTKIVFGPGALEQSLSIVNQYGYSVLLVTGENSQRASIVIDYLLEQNMRYQHLAVSGEPNITMVEEAAAVSRRFKPDMVIAMGGGSAIDMGKSLAAIIPNQGNVYDYVEVVGRNVPLKSNSLPMITIPTTASTGAEVSNKAVLRSAQDQVKVSLRSPNIFPDIAIVDPSLTYTTKASIVSRGAMATFNHLLEAYVCGEPNPLTDMICEQGLKKLSENVIAATVDADAKAREQLSFAATLGGIAISNVKLGAAHGLSSSLGGKLNIAHSIITARLAPIVMAENIAVAQQEGRADIIARYKIVSEIMTKNSHARHDDCIGWAQMMLEQLRLPSLTDYGICQTSFDQVARDALQSNSIKGNPVPLTEQRLIYILQQVCACVSSADGAVCGQSEGMALDIRIEEMNFQSKVQYQSD